MKKIIVLLFTLFLGFGLISCASKDESKTNENEEVTKEEVSFKEELKVIAPFGAPLMSLGGVMGIDNLVVEGSKGVDPVKAALTSGSHDVIIAPVNLGAQLYMKGASKYKLAAVVTKNNAYIVTKSENKLDSVSDLQNQEVLAFGQTGIPGSLLKKVYEKNNLDLKKVEFLKSSVDVYTAFSEGTKTQKYALMSEPEISRLKVNNKLEVKTLDISKVLGSDFAQAGIFVKEKTEDISLLLSLIESNVLKANTDSLAYATLIINKDKSFAALGKDVLTSALPNLGLTLNYHPQTIVSSTLNILGLSKPDDAFYLA